MTRMELSEDGITAIYTFILNPIDVDWPTAQQSTNIKSDDVFEGESITFTPYFDTRRHKLIWQGVRADSTTTFGIAFAGQLAVLESYIGSKVYFRANEVGTAFGAFATWTYIKVISVDKTPRAGQGLTYSLVEFVFELAEE